MHCNRNVSTSNPKNEFCLNCLYCWWEISLLKDTHWLHHRTTNFLSKIPDLCRTDTDLFKISAIIFQNGPWIFQIMFFSKTVHLYHDDRHQFSTTTNIFKSTYSKPTLKYSTPYPHQKIQHERPEQHRTTPHVKPVTKITNVLVVIPTGGSYIGVSVWTNQMHQWTVYISINGSSTHWQKTKPERLMTKIIISVVKIVLNDISLQWAVREQRRIGKVTATH